jgi:hypothetical protein
MSAERAWYLVFALLGCAPEEQRDLPGPERDRDARVIESPDAGTRLASSISCDAASGPREGPKHAARSLGELCEELERAGRIRCPGHRDELVRAQGAACDGTRYPHLVRQCGFDYIGTSRGEDERATWVFAGQTGELVGARVWLEEFVCGRGAYIAGQQWFFCDGDHVLDCSLCESGPARDAACPPEIVRMLPSVPCAAPEPPLSCVCEDPTDVQLPEQGSSCSSTSCERCQSGTCDAECVCVRDGARHWKLGCTE